MIKAVTGELLSIEGMEAEMEGGAVIVGSSKGEGHPNEKGDGVFNSSADDVDDGRGLEAVTGAGVLE